MCVAIEEQEAPAVGKETMATDAVPTPARTKASVTGDATPPARGHAIERTARSRRENDGALAVPGSSLSGRCVTHPVRGPTLHVDGLQRTIREESDETAVGRPEGERRIIGARERACLQAVQCPHPDADRLGPDLRQKRHLPAVR